MELDKFKKQAAALYDWTSGQTGRVFYINNYLGYEITTNGNKLRLVEADNGGAYAGEVVTLLPEEIDEMYFNEDEYKFMITTMEDSEHNGQGYDIEAYELTRMEFPLQNDEESEAA